jgi:hypothetical protein
MSKNSNRKASRVQVPNQIDPEGIKMTSDARTPNSLEHEQARKALIGGHERA